MYILVPKDYSSPTFETVDDAIEEAYSLNSPNGVLVVKLMGEIESSIKFKKVRKPKQEKPVKVVKDLPLEAQCEFCDSVAVIAKEGYPEGSPDKYLCLDHAS